MMQRLVDSALGVAKESLKTVSQETFQSFVKIVNGFSAILLAVLPGKTSALEGVIGWEQYPTFRPPRMPKWMEEGVSSFNQFLPDFDFDSEDIEYESEYTTDSEHEESAPSSPCSGVSRMSRGSSSFRSGSFRRHSYLRRIWRRLTWPIRYVLRLLRIVGRSPSGNLGNVTPGTSSLGRDGPGRLRRTSGSSGSLKSMFHVASKHLTDMRDLVVNHRTTDSRRRGIVEDLQLGAELFIERVFEVVRRWIHYGLSPLETCKAVFRRIFFPQAAPKEDDNTVVVPTATLGDSDPSLKPDRRYALQPLNTDARTCGDFITSMGYPYESLKVTTTDGYILLLERIPRHGSKKVLYLQHGILDSSLGWVFGGVVGSQAFAAYDQGFDVFLGNFRGLASRDHVNKRISSQRYWNYSVNEHGTQDIPAMLDKVHELKMNELKKLNVLGEESLGSSSENGSSEKLPYSICGVSHSLGGAAMLIYMVTRRLEGKPHYLKRAILLSPAGFHGKAPPACVVLHHFLPIFAPVVKPFFPGLYIPTKFFRMVFNKLSRDFQNYPALGGLVQTLMSYVVGGDSSNWVGAIGMTHYNMEDMPGIAWGVALHLAQMMGTKRFMMYNYGTAKANMQAYGTPHPLDIGANYGVIDIPVDVVAGKKDKLIPKSMIVTHYQHLKDAGVKASYSEFEYAHLDFTFSNKDEVLDYVMSRLLLVQPNTNVKLKRRHRRSKTLNDARRKDWDQLSEGDKEFYRESSSVRSKSFVQHRYSQDVDNSQGEEISGSGNNSGNTTITEVPREGDEEAETPGRNSSENLNSLDSSETPERMSYQDAHAAALKFVKDLPKTGFGMKDVISSLRSRNSQSKSSASNPAHRSENSQQQNSSSSEGNDIDSCQVVPESVMEALPKPSNLRKLRIPRSDADPVPSSRNGRHQNGQKTDFKAL
ncbi:unnamed protein product [Calypogeia fissa]